MINNGKDVSCYGCGVCVIACPVNIISMAESVNGFYVPIIENKDACIKCDLCIKVCSYTDDNVITQESNTKIIGYSAYNKNSIIRKNSTSGGIGIEIARAISEKGYNLCGVEYDSENHISKHFISNNIDGFEKSKGSKYIQSFTIDAFKEFNENSKYLVFGTPCQIDSLRRYIQLKKIEDNFFLVDFFCHGVPSYNLWRKYLVSLKKKININKNTNISFRDKINGWHNFTMGFYDDSKVKYSKLTSNDLFLSMFLGNYCLNKCCYNCKFRLDNSSADIRFGDLWGKKYQTNEEGISGLLGLTNKGNDLVKELGNHCDINKESLEIIFEGQMKGGYPIPNNYDQIMAKLKSNISLKRVYWRYGYVMILKNLVPKRIKELIKIMLKK